MAIGASAARGRGNKDVVKSARQFMRGVHLDRFATSDPVQFRRRLDSETNKLLARLPRSGASWGLSRKLLNIFLRDCLYNGYLSHAYGLDKAEELFEVPLDSITGHQLKRTQKDLPRWLGVRRLSPAMSTLYQEAAQRVAARKGLARVHLDAFWWGDRE